MIIGFDLDMTLVDSRPGILATYRALSARTGVPIDAELAVSRLGPPLEVEIGHWYPPEQVTTARCRAGRPTGVPGLAGPDSTWATCAW